MISERLIPELVVACVQLKYIIQVGNGFTPTGSCVRFSLYGITCQLAYFCLGCRKTCNSPIEVPLEAVRGTAAASCQSCAVQELARQLLQDW